MVVYRYLAEQNAEGLYLDGVPLRDLTADDVAELSPYLVASVAACEFYEAISPPASDDTGGVVSVPARRRAGVATTNESAAAGVAAPTDAE